MTQKNLPPGYAVDHGGASGDSDYEGGEGWFYSPSKVPTVFYKTREEASAAAWAEYRKS
jgi:hypothetical protein